ncbi:BRO family protein [Bathymodiolus thermophilus thioautotrophic gill symbiont]|uniref:BRO family protein n=1 Tax=Bathymodiolus thermophilus thioautotrophic gill symbiont TaxID=2360 RepID=UPI000A95A17E|nr:BRO family protein [Bathymodiolus thermophilus thioautotrophic gill symbiont]
MQIFQDQKIRSHWDEAVEKWYFSIIDIMEILTEQKDYQGARNYWKVLKHRLLKEGNETVTSCNQLKMSSADGKMRLTDVADTKDILRLIQSIPSKKAEPFKQWLAQVGKERLDEIENPELAQVRMKALYEQKGYPKDWIDKRLRGIAICQNLTDEWQERGISEQRDYAILTAEISKATFGMTPSEYKAFKNLPVKSKANLRDNMDDLELIFTMLGERVTTEISKAEKPDTLVKNKKVAKRGGTVAGNARKDTEKELGRSVMNADNLLDLGKKLGKNSR